MGRAAEAHALQREISIDQRLQIDAGDDDVAAQSASRFVYFGKFCAQAIELFLREESDLAFVIFLKIEEAIAANPAAGDAFDAIDFLQWMIARLTSGVAEKIVTRGNEHLVNDHVGKRSTSNAQRPTFNGARALNVCLS